MTKVVKVGGILLEDPAKTVEAIRRVAGEQTVVVHGGGVQITRMLEKMDVKSVFIEGLRVTDENTLAAVAAALLGEVHTALVQELRRQGLPAVGMFGAVRASKKSGPWGLVGTNVQADAAALTQCVQNLLSNAFKYGKNGTMAQIEIEAHSDTVAKQVHLSITDRGPGIDTSGQPDPRNIRAAP